MFVCLRSVWFVALAPSGEGLSMVASVEVGGMKESGPKGYPFPSLLPTSPYWRPPGYVHAEVKRSEKKDDEPCLHPKSM